MEKFRTIFIAEDELSVVLGESLELLEHPHTDNAQGLLLTASLLQSLLSALRREDSEETHAPHGISPFEHLVVRVAGKVAEEAEGGWREEEGSVVTSSLSMFDKAAVTEHHSALLEAA